jgi:acyl-CoA synthetase (AMP-forming)/AMP-acid ligase II
MTAATFNLADLWEALAAAGPDAECLVAGRVRHTRRSLDEAANRVARFLRSRGVRHGEHVGVYMRNRAEFLEALLGCWKAGAVPINVNWRYVADELRYVVADADLVAMLVEREYEPLVRELEPDFPGMHTVEVLGDAWGHAVAARPAAPLDGVDRSSDDVYILYTGGTTGMPKGVIWRHEDFFYACCLGGSPLDPISQPAEIVRNAEPDFRVDALVLGPLMHGGGQWLTLIALFSGSKAIVYTERSFDARSVLALVEAERPSTIGLIGDAMGRPLAEAVLTEPDRWDVSSLVSVGNGGAMLTASVKEQLRAAFPHALLNDSFGASETGAAGREIDDQQGGRAGPAFTVDADTTVLDPETLEPAPPGVQGLLAKRGHIPLGYWKDDAKTAATFPVDARGVRWVVPGDFATIDEQGRVVLQGRGSGCINTGGEKVFPEEVEAAIRFHPDVLDAVVVGVPDDRWGQKVVALVALRPGAPEMSLDDLQAHCRDHVAGYKIPREVIVGVAPRTNVGKPDYATAGRLAREALGL